MIKKGIGAALLLALVAVVLITLKDKWAFSGSEVSKVEQSELIVAQKLARVCTPSAEKEVEVIVMASNCEPHVMRSLDSLLSQQYKNCHITYIEHDSSDETYAKALHAASKLGEEKSKLTVVRLESGKNPVEALYHHLHGLKSDTIVMVLDGFTFLSHEKVLEHINHAYANPDVWMTCSRQINHPNYDKLMGNEISDEQRRATRVQLQKMPNLVGAVSFYASLAKEIKLEGFVEKGRFRDRFTPALLTLPMFEMASNHLHFMEEVMAVHAHKGKTREQKEKIEHHETLKKLATSPAYEPLSYLVENSAVSVKAADVIVFSQDKPLHLLAALESVEKFLPVKGRVSVIYTASDKSFERGYLEVEKTFKKVDFLRVSDFEGGDFTALTREVTAPKRGESPYALILTDDHFLTELVDLSLCQRLLTKTHADTFLLSIDQRRLGSKELPATLSIHSGAMAWQVGDKGYPFPFTIGLFEKKRLSSLTSGIEPANWLTLKKHVEKNLKKGSMLLSFKENKSAFVEGLASSKLLKKWASCLFEGYKIDLEVLDVDLEEIKQGDYPLIKRGSKSVI